MDGGQPGDAVTVMPLRRDTTCPACLKGRQRICRHLGFIGIDSPGTMRQRWTVPCPPPALVRLPDAHTVTDGIRAGSSRRR